MKGQTRWLAVVCVLALWGCCMGSVEPKSKRQWESKTYDHPFGVVYKAALNLLIQKDFEIVEQDPETGIIRTNWMESKMRRTQLTLRVRDMGPRDTVVDASMKVKEKKLFGKDWKDVEPKLLYYDRLFEELDLEIYHQYMRDTEKKALERKE